MNKTTLSLSLSPSHSNTQQRETASSGHFINGSLINVCDYTNVKVIWVLFNILYEELFVNDFTFLPFFFSAKKQKLIVKSTSKRALILFIPIKGTVAQAKYSWLHELRFGLIRICSLEGVLASVSLLFLKK